MKHDIILKGYGAFMPTTPSKMLCLGTAESYGVEQLNIVPGAGWEGLVIKATFHPASSEPVVVVVGENGGVIDVPPEATANATAESSPGVIVFSGVADGVQRISANLAYTVIGHAPVEGKDSAPTPSQWEQLAVQYQSKVDKQQGSENAGKVLGIGEDGLVMPVEQTGGSGGGEKEIFWIEFDSETKTASHSPEEMMEAYAKGYLIVGRYDNCFYNLRFLNSGTAILCYTTVTYNVFDGEPLGVASEYRLTISQDKSFTHGVFMFKEPKKLPSPFSLNFSGAVTGSYDGSSETNIRIPEIPKSPVQSDWYVNDENDLAYIKNRTHWVDGLEEIFPDTELTVQENGLVFDTNVGEFIVENETYMVRWNGVDYFLKAKTFNTGEYPVYYIGNFSLTGEDGDDTGEPFVAFSVNGETGCFTSSDASTVTLGLYKVTGIHPLAESFIPETIARKSDIPAATETTLGGVKASAKTDDMTQPVGIGEDGFLFVPSAENVVWETLIDDTLTEAVVEYKRILTREECDIISNAKCVLLQFNSNSSAYQLEGFYFGIYGNYSWRFQAAGNVKISMGNNTYQHAAFLQERKYDNGLYTTYRIVDTSGVSTVANEIKFYDGNPNVMHYLAPNNVYREHSLIAKTTTEAGLPVGTTISLEVVR